jgi:hypothetical protein
MAARICRCILGCVRVPSRRADSPRHHSRLLTREQSDAIAKADTAYRQRVDSVWATLGDYLANLGDEFNSADALKHQEAAIDNAWEISKLDVQRNLPAILSPLQLRMLPWVPDLLLKTKGKVGVRTYTVGP